MNHSAFEPILPSDEALVERALPLLPEIGKLLYAAIARHPRAAGLSLGQIKATTFLALHGRRGVGEIAAGIGVSLPTASELVDRLVEIGFAERAPNPADRRQVLVWLTAEAQTFKREMHALRRDQVWAAMARLSPEERPVFVRSLEALIEALRHHPSEPPSTHVDPAPPPTTRADVPQREGRSLRPVRS